MGLQHGLHGCFFILMITEGIHITSGLTMNNNLGTSIRIGFKQNRVHIRMRRQKTGLCLHRLCPANFTTLCGYGTIKRHILRFKGRHADTLASK